MFYIALIMNEFIIEKDYLGEAKVFLVFQSFSNLKNNQANRHWNVYD